MSAYVESCLHENVSLATFFFGPFYMTKLSVCGLKLMPEGAVLVRKERLKFSGHAQVLKTLINAYIFGI